MRITWWNVDNDEFWKTDKSPITHVKLAASQNPSKSVGGVAHTRFWDVHTEYGELQILLLYSGLLLSYVTMLSSILGFWFNYWHSTTKHTTRFYTMFYILFHVVDADTKTNYTYPYWTHVSFTLPCVQTTGV